MVADQPLVLYESDRKSGRKEMDSLSDRWHEKRKGKNFAGQEISLGDYLRGNANDIKKDE